MEANPSTLIAGDYYKNNLDKLEKNENKTIMITAILYLLSSAVVFLYLGTQSED